MARTIRRFGPFTLDLGSQELLHGQKPLPLPPQQLKLLVLLTSRPNQVISRQQIKEELWQEEVSVEFDQGVNFAVSQLRGKLKSADSRIREVYIRTLPKVGYRFVCPVEMYTEPADGTDTRAPVSDATSSRIDESVKIDSSANRARLPVEHGTVIESLRPVSLDGAYGGEALICATVSLSYGAMAGLAPLAEVVYRWPEFRHWVLYVSIGAGIASAGIAALVFRLMRRRVAAGSFNSLRIAAGILSLWTVLLALALAPWLPNESIVQATFQTLTAKVGCAKSLLEALGLPALSLVPLQAVFVLKQLIASGDVAMVRKVLSRRGGLTMLYGTFVPGPSFSLAAYTVVTLWWLNANAHLLESLKTGPYYGPFVEVAAVRAAAGLITLLVVLLWYLLRWYQLRHS